MKDGVLFTGGTYKPDSATFLLSSTLPQHAMDRFLIVLIKCCTQQMFAAMYTSAVTVR